MLKIGPKYYKSIIKCKYYIYILNLIYIIIIIIIYVVVDTEKKSRHATEKNSNDVPYFSITQYRAELDYKIFSRKNLYQPIDLQYC